MLVTTAPTEVFAGWVDNNKALSNYPDLSIKVLDNRLKRYKLYSCTVETIDYWISVGLKAQLGLVMVVICSSVTLLVTRLSSGIKQQDNFHGPSNHANGTTRDRHNKTRADARAFC